MRSVCCKIAVHFTVRKRGIRRKMKTNCECCVYYEYDEDYEEYQCTMELDEDEYARYTAGQYRECPYFRDNDEYKTARKQ